MSDHHKRPNQRPQSSNSVDNSTTEKLDGLLKREPVDIEELIQFCSKGFSRQVVQTWSYYSHINDHAKFTTSTQILSKFIKVINENSFELLDFGIELIKDILTNYQKTLYRALSSIRASLANPVLRLINEIIIFQNGALLDDFVALFDFQLAVLPKLLIPTKNESSNVAETKRKEFLSIRYCFIRVLVNLLKYSSPLLRKDWLSNNGKIMSNWIKYTSVIDSNALIEMSFNIWDEKILKEASFKKLTKLKVFNEWNLQKLIPIYYSGNEEIRESLNKFILSIATDSKYGLRFTSDDSWFQSSGSNSGSSVVVNKKTFKTHNKLLYGLITSLKPWDDDMQLGTTIEILSTTQELIPPFMNYLASRGLHDPKLTSYWLGQTLLLSKLIKLDISDDLINYSGKYAPYKTVVSEFIVPSVLNKNVWIKCLQSDSLLIRQLALNLLVDSLTKLAQFTKLYELKNWNDAKLELINHVYHTIPELSNIVACLTDSYSKSKDNKIILITLLMVINGYTNLFNDNYNFSQAISKPYSDTINTKEFQSIDLVLLDNFFQLQEDESTQIKWWNANAGESSLFTSLLKIAASSTSAINHKVTNVLGNLLRQTVVFNHEQVKIDPTIILVNSLSKVVPTTDNEQLAKFWKLLDESISRCVRTPFKYLDQSNEFGRISPFILTLVEQWKFVDKSTPYDRISKWLVLFLRYSIIIGEPSTAIFKLLEDLDIDFPKENYIFQGSYEDAIFVLSTDTDLLDNTTFFELASSSTTKSILASNDVPASDFDIVGALVRIESIVLDSKSTLSNVQAVLSNILSKVGNYLFTHPESTTKFASRLYWDNLYLKYSGEKANFVSGIIAEIFQQLDNFNKGDFAAVVESKLHVELEDEQQIVLGDSLWALENDLVRSITHSEVLTLKQAAFKVVLERNLTIPSGQLSGGLIFEELHSILVQFVEKDLVVYGDLPELFESIVASNSLAILRSISSNHNILAELVSFVESKDNVDLTTYFVSSIPSSSSNSPDKDITSLFAVAKIKALELISTEDFTIISLSQLLTIFTNSLAKTTEEEKRLVLEYSLTKASNKYTSEIVNLVKLVAFEDQLVKTWINKSILYLTKIFAELSNLPESFWQFVSSFKDFLVSSSLAFNVFNRSNINALLEVIFTKWIKNETVLEFSAAIITIGGKQLFEFAKLLQIVINHEHNVLLYSKSSPRSKYFTSLIIWRLFEFDVSRNSSASLQNKILAFYNGSTRAEDLLLFQILEKIEGKSSTSWIDQVYSWDFMDVLNEDEEELIGETKLIEKKKEGFVVVLNKKYVLNGLKNYNVNRYELEPLKSKGANLANWKLAEDLYSKVDLVTNQDVSCTTYDPLFLSLLIINNDELISTTTTAAVTTTTTPSNEEETSPSTFEIKVNMKKLLDSDLFSSLLINLSTTNKQLFKITIQILSTILASLKQETQTFKEKQIFELFLTKILYTFSKQSHADTESTASITRLVITLVTRLVPILSNPGHNLYEKVFRWILKAPLIKPFEFPLYQEISTFSHLEKSEDSEVYYKQLDWFLDGVVEGIQTKEDVDFLKIKLFFEWSLNLLNNQYASTKIKLTILRILEKVIKADDGLAVLVSRFGVLAFVEQKISELKGSIADNSNNKETADTLINLQSILNLKELGLEIGTVGAGKKRVRDWTSDDLEGFVKRIVKN